MRKTGRAATRSCDVGDNLSSAADDMSRHLDLQSPSQHGEPVIRTPSSLYLYSSDLLLVVKL